MKTSELIQSLAADRIQERRPGGSFWRLLPAPLLLAAALLLGTAGLREDFALVASTPRFLFKIAVTLALAVTACGAVLRLSRPDARIGGWAVGFIAAGALLIAGVLVEVANTPSDTWAMRLLGSNATWCLRMIPMLAALPLAACLYVLRKAAPTSPVRAGAMSGLFAAAVGAALYALHCTDDSPLFVATWYGLAAVLTTAVGALLGRWLLDW